MHAKVTLSYNAMWILTNLIKIMQMQIHLQTCNVWSILEMQTVHGFKKQNKKNLKYTVCALQYS